MFFNGQKMCFSFKNKDISFSFFCIFIPFYSPISWYPIGRSYSLVSSLQLPYGLGGGKGRESCILQNTTQPSRTAAWHNAHPTRKPAAPMCRRKHRTPGNRVSVHCARPATVGWPVGISLSHRALGTPSAVHADTVARCTAFPLTHWCGWLPCKAGIAVSLYTSDAADE